MPWSIQRLKDLLPNRPFGKTSKDNRVARLVDLDYVINSSNDIFSNIEAAIDAVSVISDGVTIIGDGTLANPLQATGVESVTGLNTNNTDPRNPIIQISVDGTTITGAGTPASPLVAIPSGGETSTYSNVVFVDLINGNNTIGLINRFDRPFLTIPAAVTAAAALSGISTVNRALVYIRRGQYNGPTLTLTNNVDFYCEAGVVFTGAVAIRDNGVAVNSNIYGNLKIDNLSSGTSAPPLILTGASTVTFEFDSIISSAAAMEFIPSSTSNRYTIRGNYIYSNTFGQGYGLTVRGTSNVIIDITNSIEAIHSVIRTRNFTGNLTVNCPNIRLVAGNIYGGNFKDVLYISDSASTGNITINGDLINADPVFYGGVGTALKYRDGVPNNKVTINGNINGGVTKGTDAQIGANAELQITGNISSSSLHAVWAYGSGRFLFKNCVIRTTNVSHTAAAIAVNGTAEIFFKDCYMLNLATDQALIEINSTTARLILDGCQGRAAGTTAGTFSITTTVGGGLLYVNNSRFNKIINASLTDQYVPSGLIIDPNTQVPNIF